MARRPLIPFGLKLVFLFVFIPLMEIVTVIWLYQLTNFFVTVGLIVLSATIGVTLLKREWRKVFGRAKREGVRDPGGMLLEAAVLLVASALLISPGPFTDLVGFSILIPQIRQRYVTLLRKHFRNSIQTFAAGGGAGGMRGFHFEFRSGGVRPPGQPEEKPREQVEEESVPPDSPFSDQSPFDKLKHR